MIFLITGASGFVGRSLCAELLRRGHTVRAAVRSASIPVDNVEVVKVGSIDGATAWAESLQGIDVVIHLAARVHVMNDNAADPLAEFLRVNLYGTSNLAQQAVVAGIKRLVFLSSVKVNGEGTTETHPYTESDQAEPQDSYGVSKWQAEQSLQSIARGTRLETVIVRSPLVYGPGVKGNFIRLLAAIDRNFPLPLAGARNARSLVYVGNLVDALIACATHPAAVGQTYLVRDSVDVSTALLVEKIADALGRKSRSFYFPHVLLRGIAAVLGRSDQIDRLFGSLCVSDRKLRVELGWVQPYTLEQGLRATADWYISRSNGYNHRSL